MKESLNNKKVNKEKVSKKDNVKKENKENKGKNTKEINKTTKIVLISALVIVFIALLTLVLFVFIENKNKINTIDTANYLLKYDNTWKATKKEDLEACLMHKKSKSEFNIKIKNLDEEEKYKSINELFDSLLYNIQEQNKEYKLIYKENRKLTDNNIDGYEILLEGNESQVAVYLYKQGDKVVIFTYEALFEYFDILLDSQKEIINNFVLKEEQYDVTSSINLETKEITYTSDEGIIAKLKGTTEEKIASSNFLVNYIIPDNFKVTSYDSRYGYYSFNDIKQGATLKLSTSILKRNLYEYLDKNDSSNIYTSYNLNSYNKENEKIDKYGDKPLSYIYKNSYLTNNEITENIELVFELNQNHIFIVKLSSQGVGIPKELVDMIKIKDFKNIASNITIENENGFLIGTLKQFTDYTCKQTEEMTLKLPEGYKEVDKDLNSYEERHYVSDYFSDVKIPKYEVNYKIISINIESEIDILDKSINKTLGSHSDFKKTNDTTINDKKFQVYERGYTNLSSKTDSNGQKHKYYTNEKVLFYELQNSRYLVVIIDGNENKITDELLNKLTNFENKII